MTGRQPSKVIIPFSDYLEIIEDRQSHEDERYPMIFSSAIYRRRGHYVTLKYPASKTDINRIHRMLELHLSIGPHDALLDIQKLVVENGIPYVIVSGSDCVRLGQIMTSKQLFSGSSLEVLIRVIHIMLQVAQGLSHIYNYKDLHYVHNDLNVSNIIIMGRHKASSDEFELLHVCIDEFVGLPSESTSNKDSSDDIHSFGSILSTLLSFQDVENGSKFDWIRSISSETIDTGQSINFCFS
jgi:hypothetical protein